MSVSVVALGWEIKAMGGAARLLASHQVLKCVNVADHFGGAQSENTTSVCPEAIILSRRLGAGSTTTGIEFLNPKIRGPHVHHNVFCPQFRHNLEQTQAEISANNIDLVLLEKLSQVFQRHRGPLVLNKLVD